MLEHAHTRLTEEQYFRFCDRHPEERWELIGGLLWQHPDYAGAASGFAGPTRGHQAIVRNLACALEARLLPPCRAEESVAVRVPSERVTFRQPDVIVTCDELVAEQRFVDAPLVAIEVLSDSTAAVDLLDKPLEFAAVPSIETYLVVDSRRRRAFVFRRSERFAHTEVSGEVDLHGATVSLDELYEGITFRASRAHTPRATGARTSGRDRSSLMNAYVLKLSCPNRPGIVATISTAIFEAGFNILESHQYDDTETNTFFMRVVFDPADEGSQIDALSERIAESGRRFEMQWTLRDRTARSRMVVLVSRHHHCLADLLYRWRLDELHVDIVAVASNHPLDTFGDVDLSGIPFHYLPVTPASKEEQEAAISRVVEAEAADLVVLARYMQILSDDLARRLSGRCINIHHSFLPGFKGANPYERAHARGVKLVGATAHYVTGDLDEGPIIEQDVERISHSDTPQTLVRKGRDIERRVLAKAVRYHVEDRIILNGRKTVVFAD